MTHDEKIKLFKVYAVMQLQIFSIDDLNQSRQAMQDIKYVSKRLSELILKKHGENIKTLWNIEGGEQTNSDVLNIFEELFAHLGTCNTSELLLAIEIIKGIKSGEITIEKQNS